jgi:cytidyltransferase-like protein
MTNVAVSGGFDPLHVGHLRLLRDARALGDRLVVILNDDAWLMRKKGYVFMPEQERVELLQSVRWVDEVIIREPRESYDIAHMLDRLDVQIFANGGDRGGDDALPNPEVIVAERRGIKLVYNVGGGDKPQSSSWLVEKALAAIANDK